MDKLEKDAAKTLWQRSKLSVALALTSLVKLGVLSKLRLGSNILSYPRKQMEKTVRKEFLPSKEEFAELEFFAGIAAKIFGYNDASILHRAYPKFTGHLVDEYDTCRYIVMRDGNRVYVGIRGSKTTENWVDGFTSELEFQPELGEDAHKGYSEVARGIAGVIKDVYLGSNDEVYITGGSMGGAVATLVGWYLDGWSFKVKKIWAFANPRVSDGEYGHLPVTNVLDLRDPVVMLPSWGLFTRYVHQGKRIVYTQGKWWTYEDDWRTDLLTSGLFLTEELKVEEHLKYAEKFFKLKSDLGY